MNSRAAAPLAFCLLALCGCLSPLQKAADRGDAAEVARLAAGGADVNMDPRTTARPIDYAIRSGSVETVAALLDKGARPDGPALWYAVYYRHPRVARLLVDRGAPVTAEVMGIVRQYGMPGELIALMKAKHEGAPALEPVDPDAPPLVRLIGAGDLAGVKALLDKGMEADARVEHRKTGLHLAAEADRPAIAELLLSKGANPDARNADGWTPLMVAAHAGSEGVARALLKARADADARLDDGGNAAAIAQANGRPSIAKLLAQAGAPASVAGREEAAPVASAVDEPAYKSKPRPGDLALVVGVGEYSRLPEATYAERDAQAAARHLEALGLSKRNIITLTGSAATRGALQGYLEEWLPRNAKPGSTVFVYFSGHGSPDPKTGEAYLVPWDGDPAFLNSTAIPLKSLYSSLAKLPAKKVVVALDACFSGAGGRSVLAKGARPLVAKAEAAPAPEKLTVFAAASGDEITGGLDAEGHGLFTYFFLKGLSEGKREARGLFEYLKPLVQDEARHQNREQTPVLLGQGGTL